MYYDKLSRRQFLVGSANAMLALPFLSSLLPRWAWGQQNRTQLNRFIALFAPLGGYTQDHMFPNYLAGIPFGPYSNGHNFHYTTLRKSDGLDSISRILSSGLNPFLPKLNLIQGLDAPVTASHGDNTFLGHYYQVRRGDFDTSMPDIPSIDQFMANHPKVYPTPPVSRVLNLGSGSMGYVDKNDITKGTVHVDGDRMSAFTAWERLFGPLTPSIGGQSDAAAEASKAGFSTLVDQVLEDFNKVKQSRVISLEDKDKLNNWADEIHELQKKLVGITQGAGCVKPDQPIKQISSTYSEVVDGMKNKFYSNLATDMERELFYDLYTSVLAAGIKCGRTRIGTIRCSGKTTSGPWHDWGHQGNRNEIADLLSWQVEKILVPLLRKLDTEEMDGNTYLDNSLVMYGNINSFVHFNVNRSILTAGSGAGFFETGLYLDYRNRNAAKDFRATGINAIQPGVFYNQLLVSIMQSMGLSESDYNVLPGVLGYSGIHHKNMVYKTTVPFNPPYLDAHAGKALSKFVKGTV